MGFLDYKGLERFLKNSREEFAQKSHTHDERYYTEYEIDNKLSKKSDIDHIHDDRYYTEAEVDGKLEKKSSTDHTHDLSKLISNLSIGTSTTLNDTVQIITQDTDTANQKYYRRPLAVLWDYIKSKADNVYSAIGHNHKIQNLEDYTTRVYDATIVRPADTVLASPQDKDGIATFRKLDKNDVGLENVDNTADVNKNVATAGIATTGVRDYNNANNIIKIGWSGTELDADSLTYVAGYTSDKKIHPASKDGVRSWIGLGDYLPLSGGTMFGRIIRSCGGSWIGDRNNVAVFGNSYGQSAGYSYNPVVGQKTSSGAWTIGNISGNESLVFNYSTDANYNAAKNETSQVYLPAQAGAIITSATIGSQSVASATKASGVVDYGNTANTIQIGYGGAGATTSNLTHIAGYLSGGKQIKDVSKDVLKSWLGSLPASGGTASAANSLNPTVTFTGGNGNTTGYRLIGQVTLGQWSNYRCVMIVKSRHQGAGIVSVCIGNNTSTISQANAYSEIKYWGPQNSGSVIHCDAYKVYISADGKTGYLFWQYNDYSDTKAYVISSDFTISNGTWMTSIGSGYGSLWSRTQINAASTAEVATTAVKLARGGNTSYPMTFNWSGKSGQPTWLWGGENGTDMYVYNPSNFNVNYAKSAGSVAWGNVSGKPSTFTPSSHTHSSINSVGTKNAQTGRNQAYGNVYSYNSNASAHTGMPTTYTSTIGFGQGASGTVEICGEWTGGKGLWSRALRDYQDSWYDWQRIYTDNYHPSAGSADNGVTASGKTGAGIYYVRFGNGTQMCWGFYKESDHSGSTSFPVAFNNSQYSLSLTVTVSSNNAPFITGRSTTSFSYERHGTSYNDVQWIAVGTWK